MKHVLVAVDLQRDFVSGVLGTSEARAILPKAAEIIRGFEGEIFVTMDTHGPDYLESAEGRKLPVVHCVKDSDGWMLEETIADALCGKQYTLVEKPTFGSEELISLIRRTVGDAEFDLLLVGVCTDICVVSNALLLKAAFPETEISVDARACAGVTPEGHRAALLTMQNCQICVLN